MILTNRLFEKQAPSRQAKSIYIFCEGAKREYQYFQYFKERDSRVNIEVYQLEETEDNSPSGLLKIAQQSIIAGKNNPKPKYTFQKNDEVWIVLDTDEDKNRSRAPQIERIRNYCRQHEGWNVVQSNPCFEVWLYYHLHSNKVRFGGDTVCKNWKNFVNQTIKGGFDSRRHPLYIGYAIRNAQDNFEENDSVPNTGSTEVYLLGQSIYTILKEKIRNVLNKIKPPAG